MQQRLTLVICSPRDALTKMKDVYLKNPQMGDPASVDPRLSEIGQNIEKLQFEAQKFEVSWVPVWALISVWVSVGEDILFGLSEAVNNEEFKHTSPAGVLPKKSAARPY